MSSAPLIDIIFCGNPGVGKSTLLTCISGIPFESGLSFTSGMTHKLDFKSNESNPNVRFGDTPGLADVSMAVKASKAITEALQEGAEGGRKTMIFFVVTFEAGRVRPDDFFTIEKVMDSITLPNGNKPGSNNYGVIINKCTMMGLEKFEKEGGGRFKNEAFFARKSEAVPYTTSHLFFLPRIEEMENEDNCSYSFPGLQEWIEEFPGINIGSASEIDVRNLKKQLEDMKASNKEAMEKLEKASKEEFRKLQEAIVREKNELLQKQEEQRKEIEKQTKEFLRKQEEQRKEIEKQKNEFLQKQEKQNKEIEKLNAVQYSNAIAGVEIRNYLPAKISDVKVLFATSDKGTHTFSYIFNWSGVDIEKGDHITSKITVDFNAHGQRVIEPKGSSKVEQRIPYIPDTRHYWQVYFKYGGCRYKISKNNAQVNVEREDNNKYTRIVLKKDQNQNLYMDFEMSSGRAWFWALKY